MKLSSQGAKLLHDREGCRLTAYKDTAGVWTIGYGHTSAAGAPAVTSGMKITQAQADNIFATDIVKYEQAVEKAINLPMYQYEFDAYTSMCYNIGQSGFAGSTTVKKFNAGDRAGAAEAILMWNKPSEIMDRRRGSYYQFKGICALARVPASGPPKNAPPVIGKEEEIVTANDFTTVRGLQTILQELGYNINADGIYGPQTGGTLAWACDNGALLHGPDEAPSPPPAPDRLPVITVSIDANMPVQLAVTLTDNVTSQDGDGGRV